MNNAMLSALSKTICEDIVLVTYKKHKDILYTQFFLKETDTSFYDKNTGIFSLKAHIDNTVKKIKDTDIVKFVYVDKNSIDEVKTKFFLKAEKIKSDYDVVSKLKHTFENFDDYFFNENTQINHLKLACILEFPSLESFENCDDTSLARIKDIWKNKIELHKNEILTYLDTEINIDNSSYDEDAVTEIKELIQDFNSNSDLSQITSKEELFEYWPTILLPAPDFVNDIYSIYMNRSQ